MLNISYQFVFKASLLSALEFQTTDVFSYNNSREDGYREDGFEKPRPRSEGHRGSLDGKGGTYPAEMIGDKIIMGKISFNIGPREERAYNSLACLGQSIDLPEGTRVLHILAAADIDSRYHGDGGSLSSWSHGIHTRIYCT